MRRESLMSVLRHYFISDNLDDLEVLEEELEARNVETSQIHVLSLDDSGTENHVHIHDVTSLMKRDVIHSGEMGFLVGVIGAVLVLAGAYFFELTNTAAGWIPFIFLSVVVLGFCTWEGGFIGIQRTNVHFKRFEEVLNQGKHVFFVDLTADQEGILDDLIKRHPGLELAGTEKGTPALVMKGQKQIPHLLRETLP
ncbi:MAG: hypothetical protein ACI9UU_002177 [Candidatus Azotimanducaceae bacterium]|jgi:hypothetical protein